MFKMKAFALILLVAVCYVECRKIYPQINKNANVDFINMESGGVMGKPAVVEPPKPAAAIPAPTTKAPTPAPVAKPVAQPSPNTAPKSPSPTPAPVPKPVAPQPQKPAQPSQAPTQVKPVPVNPAPVANPITTPGPGSVKSLINFYDSRGNASPIRPYSYSQAVKQG